MLRQNKPHKPDTIKLHLMQVSITYGKLLIALHNLHKVVKDDVEDATNIENMIYALEGIAVLRKNMHDKHISRAGKDTQA